MKEMTPPNGSPDMKRTLWFIIFLVLIFGGIYGCNKYHENQLRKLQPNPPGVTEG